MPQFNLSVKKINKAPEGFPARYESQVIVDKHTVLDGDIALTTRCMTKNEINRDLDIIIQEVERVRRLANRDLI